MLAIVLLTVFVCLSVVAAEFVRMEPSINVFQSENWKAEKVLAGDEPISAIFALKNDPAKLAELEREFWEISDPKNKRYGQYYTVRNRSLFYLLPSRFKSSYLYISTL